MRVDMASGIRFAAFAFLVSTIVLISGCAKRPQVAVLRAPAGDRPTEIVPGGTSILPNGRLITPMGVQVKVEPHPYGMALSPNGKILMTSNNSGRLECAQ